MLLPKFSIRALLIATTLVAFLSLTISFALQEKAWAIAVLAAVGGGAATFGYFALFFAISWLLLSALRLVRRKRSESPFQSAEQPPRQMLPTDNTT